MRGGYENNLRDFGQGGDIRQAAIWNPTNNLPGVQPHTAEQNGSVLVGHLQAGWGGLALLALLIFRGRVLR